MTNSTLYSGDAKEQNMMSVVLSTIALVLLILIALTGNALVCIAFYRSFNLRSVTNMFIVSLAVTDILVASISIPIWLSVRLSGCLVPFSCNIHLYFLWLCLDILFSAASIMNLCAISVDRLIAITSPLKYPNILTKPRAAIALLAIWPYAGFMATLVMLKWKYYPIFASVLAFITPLTIMLYSYIRIFRAALSQVRRVYPLHQQFYFKREYKAARTLAIVMGAFIVCWTPFFLMNILVNFYEGLHVTIAVTDAIKALHYTNSALNPIIYSCSNRDFRQRIFRALPCGGSRIERIETVGQFWSASFKSTTRGGSNSSHVPRREGSSLKEEPVRPEY